MSKLFLMAFLLFSANIFAGVTFVKSLTSENSTFVEYQDGDTTKTAKLHIHEKYNLSFDHQTLKLMISDATESGVASLIELVSKGTAYAVEKPYYFILDDETNNEIKLSKEDEKKLQLKSIPVDYPLSVKFEEVSDVFDENFVMLKVKIFYYNITSEQILLKEINSKVNYIPKVTETPLEFDDGLGNIFVNGSDIFRCKTIFCKYEMPKLKKTKLANFQLSHSFKRADQLYAKHENFPLGHRFMITSMDNRPVQEIEFQGALLIKKSSLKKHNYLVLKNGEFYSPNIYDGYGTSLDENELVGRNLVGFSYISFERKLNASLFETYLVSNTQNGVYEVIQDSSGRFNAYLLDEHWIKISDTPDFSFLQTPNRPVALFETQISTTPSDLLQDIKMLESSNLLNSFSFDYSLLDEETKNYLYLILKEKSRLERVHIENFLSVGKIDEKIKKLLKNKVTDLTIIPKTFHFLRIDGKEYKTLDDAFIIKYCIDSKINRCEATLYNVNTFIDFFKRENGDTNFYLYMSPEQKLLYVFTVTGGKSASEVNPDVLRINNIEGWRMYRQSYHTKEKFLEFLNTGSPYFANGIIPVNAVNFKK